MSPINFKIEKRLSDRLGRVGQLNTPSGPIETPAFVVVGTKGTVKSLSPEQVKGLGAQVVLANTYHLYLQPGEVVVEKAGGLGKFMNWQGVSMTDSGGFQVLSLGEAFGTSVTKIAKAKDEPIEKRVIRASDEHLSEHGKLALIDEEGVTFRSHIDGSEHRFTPEKSIEIQHKIGADMIFAFDEATGSSASFEYQREAMERTHRWAQRCLEYHMSKDNSSRQALLGIVQGGRFEDLRKESAQFIGNTDFDGFGIGGSYVKEDLDEVLIWVNEILPEEKPRHLLGIGEPEDLFLGVEHGVDLFDCVAPTRMARNGGLYTKEGKINITNACFKNDHNPVEKNCECYTCQNYSKSYLNHLFRAREMTGATLASIHNLYFIVNLVKGIRQSILEERFFEHRDKFLNLYRKSV